MNKTEAYQLTHPELLSVKRLCEILENRCIVVPAFQSLSKEELIEIYKRVALPMPQRTYDNSATLEKAHNDIVAEKSVETTEYDESTDLPTATGALANTTKESCDTGDAATKDRPKPPISDRQQIFKKIRLSDTCERNNISEKDTKRKSEVSSLSNMKKRQKITWP